MVDAKVNGARIAVVGGGLAGLAAAIECADAGAEVTLYEARSRLGGATFSFERNGLWLDNGQHVALRCCTAYLGFLRRLGVEHLLPLQGRLRVPVLREGRAPAFISRVGLPAPLHLAPSLLSSGRNVYEALGAGFTLLALGISPDALRAFRSSAERLHLPLTIVHDDAPALRERYAARLLLIRPDQFVAWSSSGIPEDPLPILARALGHG